MATLFLAQKRERDREKRKDRKINKMSDSKKIKVWKLRSQDEPALAEALKKLKEELQQLRVAKVAGGTAAKLGKIKVSI